MKQATTLDEQIKLLQDRNVIVDDENKAKECLLDIGYYRLCSYFFPFEKTYPDLKNRNHEVIDGVHIKDAVDLYYFDFDMRIVLIRFTTRIEVAIRTYLTYILSNKYKKSPTWFADPSIVNASYTTEFDTKAYDDIMKKPVIRRHHKNHINDKYAPAWKTIEYMSFGNIENLYKNLKKEEDKTCICKHFGVNSPSVFENYIATVRYLRNICAHGGVLFDMKLPKGISKGPAGSFHDSDRQNLYGSLKVVEFLLGQISTNRLKDMKCEIAEILNNLYDKNINLKEIIEKTAGKLHYEKIIAKFASAIVPVQALSLHLHSKMC